jgi:type II secretory pathway component PulF
MGNFIKDYGMFVVLALILIIVSLQYIYKKNKNVRLKIDKKIYSINFFKEALIGKVSHMISFLLAEGLPLTQAIALGSKTINNQFLQTNLEDVVEDIKSGKNFSHSAESKKIFPEIFVAAVKTGEKSGELSEILDRIGEFYSKRVEKYTATFISLIEPLFIVFIGVVVGFIVLSVMGPLFDLNTIVD